MTYQQVLQTAQEKGYQPYFTGETEKMLHSEFIELTLIQKWLRDEHLLHIRIDFAFDFKTVESSPDLNKVKPTLWGFFIDKPAEKQHWNRLYTATSYKEALLQGIDKALSFI